MQRSVPSGTLSIFWIVPIVPTRRRSSGPGIFGVLVLERDEADLLAFAQRFFDEHDARRLDDGERNHGVRKEHRVLQRQNAENVGGYHLRGAIRPGSF